MTKWKITPDSLPALPAPLVLALGNRVEARPDETFRRDEAAVRVTLSDGRLLERRVAHPLGSIERPLDDPALSAKLHELAGRPSAKGQPG